jgi:hypothetical protein
MIRSYFSFFVVAGSPIHGKPPRRKYIKIYPKLSRSSRRLYSIPRCVFTDEYRAVPVKLFPSLYGIWSLVFGFQYFFARPKSIM